MDSHRGEGNGGGGDAAELGVGHGQLSSKKLRVAEGFGKNEAHRGQGPVAPAGSTPGESRGPEDPRGEEPRGPHDEVLARRGHWAAPEGSQFGGGTRAKEGGKVNDGVKSSKLGGRKKMEGETQEKNKAENGRSY